MAQGRSDAQITHLRGLDDAMWRRIATRALSAATAAMLDGGCCTVSRFRSTTRSCDAQCGPSGRAAVHAGSIEHARAHARGLSPSRSAEREALMLRSASLASADAPSGDDRCV